MKHWEVEHNGHHIRITWQVVCPPYEVKTFDRATRKRGEPFKIITFNCKPRSEFALQTPIGGQWVDYKCFNCGDIETEQEALEYAMEFLHNLDQDHEEG